MPYCSFVFHKIASLDTTQSELGVGRCDRHRQTSVSTVPLSKWQMLILRCAWRYARKTQPARSYIDLTEKYGPELEAGRRHEELGLKGNGKKEVLELFVVFLLRSLFFSSLLCFDFFSSSFGRLMIHFNQLEWTFYVCANKFGTLSFCAYGCLFSIIMWLSFWVYLPLLHLCLRVHQQRPTFSQSIWTHLRIFSRCHHRYRQVKLFAVRVVDKTKLSHFDEKFGLLHLHCMF